MCVNVCVFEYMCICMDVREFTVCVLYYYLCFLQELLYRRTLSVHRLTAMHAAVCVGAICVCVPSLHTGATGPTTLTSSSRQEEAS